MTGGTQATFLQQLSRLLHWMDVCSSPDTGPGRNLVGEADVLLDCDPPACSLWSQHEHWNHGILRLYWYCDYKEILTWSSSYSWHRAPNTAEVSWEMTATRSLLSCEGDDFCKAWTKAKNGDKLLGETTRWVGCGNFRSYLPLFHCLHISGRGEGLEVESIKNDERLNESWCVMKPP